MNATKEKFNQAEKLKDQGKYEEARDLLLTLIEETPDHVLSHLTLARIFTNTGDHLSAVKHAEAACQLEPNEAFNYTILSVTYQKAWAGTQDQRFIQLAEDAMARSRMLGG
ncbi:MAG: scaffolding protein [Planctomycetes bacterium]|nr:scaffolding protein [Planctomycetota bacterium]